MSYMLSRFEIINVHMCLTPNPIEVISSMDQRLIFMLRAAYDFESQEWTPGASDSDAADAAYLQHITRHTPAQTGG